MASPVTRACVRAFCALASLAPLSIAGFQSNDSAARFVNWQKLRTCANVDEGLTQSFGNFHLAAKGFRVTSKSHSDL